MLFKNTYFPFWKSKLNRHLQKPISVFIFCRPSMSHISQWNFFQYVYIVISVPPFFKIIWAQLNWTWLFLTYLPIDDRWEKYVIAKTLLRGFLPSGNQQRQTFAWTRTWPAPSPCTFFLGLINIKHQHQHHTWPAPSPGNKEISVLVSATQRDATRMISVDSSPA